MLKVTVSRGSHPRAHGPASSPGQGQAAPCPPWGQPSLHLSPYLPVAWGHFLLLISASDEQRQWWLGATDSQECLAFSRERQKESVLHKGWHSVFRPHSRTGSNREGPLGICFSQDHSTEHPLRAKSAMVTKWRRIHPPFCQRGQSSEGGQADSFFLTSIC